MNSTMFKLNVQDVSKGIALAVIVAFLGAIQQALSAHGLDVASYNWGAIINLAVTAGIGYLAKNFISDSNGAVLGKFGGTK